VRATLAASTFFEPIEINGETFVNDVLGANNPVYQLWTEAGDQWSDMAGLRLEDRIACLVSIGTGEPSLESFSDGLLAVATTLKEIATENSHVAAQFQTDWKDLDNSRRLFRFDVTHGLKEIGLEETDQWKLIETATRNYLEQQAVHQTLENCASILEECECTSHLYTLDRRLFYFSLLSQPLILQWLILS
jgi:hypothetical protein